MTEVHQQTNGRKRARKRDRGPKAQTQQPYLIKYDAKAIARGRELVARLNSQEEAVELTQWELGELADGLETKYGDETLPHFAKDIGIDADKLSRCRSVFRAYRDGKIKGPSPKFGVLQALQGHPDRTAIIAEKPRTVREARGIMRAYRLAQGQKEDKEQEGQEQKGQKQEQEQQEDQDKEPEPEPTQEPESEPTEEPEPDWDVIEMRRTLAELTELVLKIRTKYGHLSRKHINLAVLRQALDEPGKTVDTWREVSRDLSNIADVVESAFMFEDVPDEAVPSDATPDTGTPPDDAPTDQA